MTNRLAAEASPYLLQHAENPVDWYPWGEPAFEKSRREDRPIFLSIGYSTCHWCHVMEHESFEDDQIAAVLNAQYVPIKVDREERPDVDRVYMTFVQATTGSGGWPMSVWLTPDLEPFYGGTYFPPASRWGRPGFLEVLEEIARVWKADRSKVIGSARTMTDRLREISTPPAGLAVADVDALTRGVRQFRAAFDTRRGGFGTAPKFPRPSELLFLFREYARSGDESARDMALATLRAMALGGMRDHIGGGFHRYSVDADWRVPHFEKMLYDQAQLTLAYLEAVQITGDRFYADVAEDTLHYVAREMTDPGGGFFSAEDADSVPPEHAADPDAHKSEGAFYIWTDEEIGELLGEDADVFRARFGIRPGGNAPEDPQGEFTGKNLVYTAASLDEVADTIRKDEREVRDALTRSRVALFAARVQRPRPHLDDKVLTAWNGLMIAAFARGARVLRAIDPDAAPRAEAFLDAARRASMFLRGALWDADHEKLLRRYRRGAASIDGYAEDYAFLTFGLLELFQADGNPEWLEWAQTLQRRLDEQFRDPAGGWFSTTGADPRVLLRLKEDYDGAEPSASSVAVLNLLSLAHLTGDTSAQDRIDATLKLFGPKLGELARAVPMMMAALATYYAPPSQVAIVGPPADVDARGLLDAASSVYRPFSLIVPIDPQRQQALTDRLPWLAAMRMVEGRPAAYVCRDFACQQPVTTRDALLQALAAG
jgi:uncharacterized protein YyaL (SSP411 family)